MLLKKQLIPGSMVKTVNQPKWSNYFNKKGFIVKTLAESDSENPGRYSVYLLTDEKIFHGDLLGNWLEPTGDFVEKKFLIEYKEKHSSDDFVRDELDSLIELL